ncbi:alpha/beta fold hydrolase [Desulfosporosinus sp. Sb-LF]|uniref:alpha/beta fold hydrolase n=1 Tax=Desulfosporosinus sp. Sb-LF TaxID=2560027 RepID=UPI0018EE74A0|nr:alpha/beta fold hydrolase [Desulfosporosinus sp. Sb-LF]
MIALDSRGHGKSDKPLQYTLDDHVKDVISLLDHLKIERASILGVSMGSYIAQGVAVTHPERVDKLILVVPKSNGKTTSMKELLARHKDELKGLGGEEQMQFLSKHIYHNFSAIQKRITEIGQYETILTSEQQEAASKALEAFDFRQQLPYVIAETLVISGKYDGLNPPERGREIAILLPHASFVEFENSGHIPPAEEPERFLKVVTDFLEQ